LSVLGGNFSGVDELSDQEVDALVSQSYYRTLRPLPEIRAAMGFPQDYRFTRPDGKSLAGWQITYGLGQAVHPGTVWWLVDRAVRTLL